MKILIIQTAFIGDVVLATPLIEKLKIRYPDSKIDFLVRNGNEALFDQHPHLHKVLVFNKKNKYRNLFFLIKEIRLQRYDYVINVQRFFSTGLMTVLSRGKVKIGFDKNPLSFLFTHKYQHYISTDKYVHEVERNLLLIQNLTDLSFQKPKLYCFPQHEAIVPKQYKYICIAPTSTWFTKQFPFEKWCELIHKLPKAYKIHLIGGPQDVEFCKRIQAATDPENVIVSAGELSLLQSAALIKHAQMTFSNDSANLHFASAVNAPVIALFCSTVPQFGFGPLSDNAGTVETNLNLACRPCGLHGKKACPEKHFNCSNIPIEKIITEANKHGIE